MIRNHICVINISKRNEHGKKERQTFPITWTASANTHSNTHISWIRWNCNDFLSFILLNFFEAVWVRVRLYWIPMFVTISNFGQICHRFHILSIWIFMSVTRCFSYWNFVVCFFVCVPVHLFKQHKRTHYVYSTWCCYASVFVIHSARAFHFIFRIFIGAEWECQWNWVKPLFR